MFDDTFIKQLAEALVPKLADLLYPRLRWNPMPTQEWFTTSQAAFYIGASVPALRHMIKEGKLPVYRIGDRQRLRRADLDAMWERNKEYKTE